MLLTSVMPRLSIHLFTLGKDGFLYGIKISKIHNTISIEI